MSPNPQPRQSESELWVCEHCGTPLPEPRDDAVDLGLRDRCERDYKPDGRNLVRGNRAVPHA